MHVAFVYTEQDRWALGIRHISSKLQQAGYRTSLYLMSSLEEQFSKSVLDEIERATQGADVVAVGCFSRGAEKARQVLQRLKGKGKFCVWGGIHATLNPDDCAPDADLVCVGEGEEFMVDLLSRLQSGKDWRDIENGAYLDNGVARRNTLHPLNDLDSLPLLDYVNEEEFYLENGVFGEKNQMDVPAEPILFIGSRGCAFHCTYCTNSRLKEIYRGHGSYLRRMGASKYVEHAAALKDIFRRSGQFYFIDEDFFARPTEEIRDFCMLYTEKVGVPFECMGSPLQITEEKMELLVGAGLWRIRMGVETGSERIKKEIYQRPISNQKVQEAVRIINRYPHVIPYYFLIIANPYEEEQDLVSTAIFAAELPSPFFIQTFNLVFFPESLRYERAVRDGIIGGKGDSGWGIDTRGGLEYKKYRWKEKNLYMNGLLFLMEGKSTTRRLGSVPRFLLEHLLRENVRKFNSDYLFFIKLFIEFKKIVLSLRKRVALFITSTFGSPKYLFGPKLIFKPVLLKSDSPPAAIE